MIGMRTRRGLRAEMRRGGVGRMGRMSTTGRRWGGRRMGATGRRSRRSRRSRSRSRSRSRRRRRRGAMKGAMKTLEAREREHAREREILERGPGRGRVPDEAQKRGSQNLYIILFFN
jgi:hypothetical protein